MGAPGRWLACLAVFLPTLAIPGAAFAQAAQTKPKAPAQATQPATAEPKPAGKNPGPAKPWRPPIVVLREEVKALKSSVAELGKALADVGAANKALQDVENRLIAIQVEVDRAGKARQVEDDWRRELDRLTAEVGQLRGRVSELWERSWREDEGGGAVTTPALRSVDGRFEIRLGTRMKLRYDYEERQGEKDASGFRLSQGKVITTGHVWSSRLRYNVQLEFAKRVPLEDFWVEYRRWKYARVMFGQFKPPIVRQQMSSSGKLQFPDVSDATSSFRFDRDLGVMIAGDYEKLVEYSVGVLNGGGPNQLNDNRDMLYVTRLVLSPLATPAPMSGGDQAGGDLKVSFGGAFAFNLLPTDIVDRADLDESFADQDADGEVDNVGVYLVGVEVAAHWKGASLLGEYFWRLEDPGAVGPDRTFTGAYGQVGYYLLPAHVELAARVSWAEPHHYGADLADRLGLPAEVREVSGVVTYARFGHNLKLQLEYANRKEQDVGAPAGSTTSFDRTVQRVRTQLQVGF